MSNTNLQLSPEVQNRLQETVIIWLTTVGSDGTPHPNPVWFYWDGKTFFIHSQPTSAKLKNIPRHPRVALNLESSDALGDDIFIIAGDASIERNPSHLEPGFAEKYAEHIRNLGMTVEEFEQDYSVLIKITPTKFRAW